MHSELWLCIALSELLIIECDDMNAVGLLAPRSQKLEYNLGAVALLFHFLPYIFYRSSVCVGGAASLPDMRMQPLLWCADLW